MKTPSSESLAASIARELGKSRASFGPQATELAPTPGTVEVVIAFAAATSAQPATYRIEREGDALFVSLVMADRWQSHSIEAHLLHTGDKIEELVAEELAELAFVVSGESRRPSEHFRSEDKLFTFRTRLAPSAHDESAPRVAAAWLAAYEAAFRQLGDMDALNDQD